MAFYGERFQRPDEEDIWEELAKMISNPPSEVELMQKKRNSINYIESLLHKDKQDTLHMARVMAGAEDK